MRDQTPFDETPSRNSLAKGVAWIFLMLLLTPLMIVVDALRSGLSILILVVALAIGLTPPYLAFHLNAPAWIYVPLILCAPLTVYLIFRTSAGRRTLGWTED